MKEFVLNGKKYEILENLGEGTYGTVVKATHSGETYAIKFLFPPKNKSKAEQKMQEMDFCIEKIILEALKKDLGGCKKGVMCYEDAFKDAEHEYVFITKYYDGLDLEKFLKRFMKPNQVEPIMTNIINAYMMINKAGVIHRDIKPSNMIVDPKTLEITFIDFGFSCFDNPTIHEKLAKRVLKRMSGKGSKGVKVEYEDIEDDLECEKLRGSPIYMSPDYIEKGYATVQTDIFALGVTFLYLLSGQESLYKASATKGANVEQFYKNVLNKNSRKPVIKILENKKFSGVRQNINVTKAAKLIEDMTAFHPDYRPTLEEIKKRLPKIFF